MPNETLTHIRLTPKQRLTLMDMANQRGSIERMDHDVAVFLTHVQLIEKRSRFTPDQKRARIAKRKGMLKQVITAARQADLKSLSKLVGDLDSDQYHDNDSAYFLKPAAQEYLIQGTVTIKTKSGMPRIPAKEPTA